MPVISLGELAELVDGRVVGDPTTLIRDAKPLRDAAAGDITLADSVQMTEHVNASAATAVVACSELPNCTLPILVAAEIHVAFLKVIEFFRPNRRSYADGVHCSAVIDTSSSVGSEPRIGPGVHIDADCHIGDRCTIHSGAKLMPGCVLGDDCVVFPNVTLYEETRIGNRVTLHAGCVVGSYGFGYHQQAGRHIRGAQCGWVHIEDDCEIGANTVIDRGTYGVTRIGTGTKIDNLTQVAHNCHIGPHNLICAQVGIAGSCTTGTHVVMAGQVGVKDHVQISDQVQVGAQAGIMRDVESGQVIFGSPAVPRKQKMVEVALVSKLPEMRKQLKQLEKQMDSLMQSRNSVQCDAA